MIAIRRTSALPRLHQSEANFVHSRWFPVAAVVSAVSLAPDLGRDTLAWAALAFAGLVGTYASLIRTFEADSEQNNGILSLDMRSVVCAITYRTLGVLFVAVSAVILLGPSRTGYFVAKSMAVGVIKAAHWMSMLSLVGTTRSAGG